jgi:DNA-binding transcriptional MocR family regulator
VIAAYRHLEHEGLILAEPRAGFRVLPGSCARPHPRTPEAQDLPAPVNLCDLMTRAMVNREVPGMVSLGMAVPRPPLLPLPALQRHLGQVARTDPAAFTTYDGPMGRPELRGAIARRMTLAGAVVDPEQILITNGAQEGLLLALRAVCPPGSCVAIESPAYHGVIQAVGSLGLQCLEIPCSSSTGLAVDALRLALDDHPIAAVVCTGTFSNPAGGSIPQANLRDLVGLCARRGIPLIDDDTYGDLAHAGVRPAGCLAQTMGSRERAGSVIHIGSWSKSIAPGLRLGFVIGGRWHDRIQMQKVVMNIATASAPQLAVAALLDSGDFDRHWQRTRPRLRTNVHWTAAQILATFPDGTRVSEPAGDLVLWVEMPDAVDCDRLYADGIRARVCVAPGTLFSARKRYRHHLRITGAWYDTDVEQAITRLGVLALHQARQFNRNGRA